MRPSTGTRRPQSTARVPPGRARCGRDDLPAVPVRQRVPRFMSSAGWFTYERRFVEWAEARGIEFDYAVSSDLDRDPSVVDGYDLVMGVGHDEYWSAQQRRRSSSTSPGRQLSQHVGQHDVLAGATRGRSSSHGLLQVPCARGRPRGRHRGRVDDVGDVGRPDRRQARDGVAGSGVSPWSVQPLRRGDAARLGGIHRLSQRSLDVRRHWIAIRRSVGRRRRRLGYETVGCRLGFDAYQLPIAAGGDGTPEQVEIVAFTPSSNLAMGEYPASIAALDDQGDLEFVASACTDA